MNNIQNFHQIQAKWQKQQEEQYERELEVYRAHTGHNITKQQQQRYTNAQVSVLSG